MAAARAARRVVERVAPRPVGSGAVGTVSSTTTIGARSVTTRAPPMAEKDTIVRLLYTIGSREEVEQYLELFSSVDTPKFAVIKIGGAVLDEEMDTLTTSLTFLHKVGLHPIVLHGAGPQLNKNLEKAGIEAVFHEGIRVTDPRTLEIARKVFYNENIRLVEALESMGTRARPITTGTFVADYLDRQRYNLVGKITSVNVAAIESAIRTGALPILTSLAETPDGQILNVNADVAASELAKVIQPLKVVYLSGQGGLYNGETNKKIDVINLDEEFNRLMQQPWVKYGTKLKIREINELLHHLPRNASVSITSASNLSRELFTHKGAGTLLRRGNKLKSYSSLDGLDSKKLLTLISSSMVGQREHDHNSLLSILSLSKCTVYTDDDFQGLAIVREPQPNSSLPVPVLEVFALTHDGQMSNFRDNLWEHLRRDYRQLCWHTHASAEVKSWFFEHTEGSYSVGNSTVFWYGLEDLDKAKACVTHLLSQTPTHGHHAAAAAQKIANGINFAQKRSYSSAGGRGRAVRVGLIGARGYVGREFMKILAKHPEVELACVSSRELAGKPVDGFDGLKYSSLSPADCAKMDHVNCWVLALPNNLAKPYVDALGADKLKDGSKRVLLDLSADYRFDTQWTYGMPEINRDNIRTATRISNPGCYATGAQLALRPLFKHVGFSGTPSVFGVSGYSGAGTTPSDRNNPEFLKDNLVPYSLTNHVHEREVSHHLGSPIRFMPHVAPFFQGITLTVSVPFSRETTVKGVEQIFRDAYAGEKLVRVTDNVPLVKDNSAAHHLALGGFAVAKDGRHGVVVCTLDNLLKGAATQATQNMNLAFGLPELQGIDAFL